MKKLIAVFLFLAPLSAFGADNVLTWEGVAGADGYTVYGKNEACSTDSLSYTPIENIPAGTHTTIHSTGASDGFDWCYRLTAYNANGESVPSQEAGKVPGAPILLVN